MKISKEQKVLVFSPQEFEAVSGYLAERASELEGWTITVDCDYGFIQGIQRVLADAELKRFVKK